MTMMIDVGQGIITFDTPPPPRIHIKDNHSHFDHPFGTVPNLKFFNSII